MARLKYIKILGKIMHWDLGNNPVLDSWLQERQQVIHLIEEITHSLPDLDNFRTQGFEEHEIPKFCQVLTDYTSLGHFEAFQQIFTVVEESGKEIDPKWLKWLDNTYSSVSAIVSFTDKYATTFKINSKEEYSDFKDDVQNLFLVLANRLHFEDKLLQLYVRLTKNSKLKI